MKLLKYFICLVFLILCSTPILAQNNITDPNITLLSENMINSDEDNLPKVTWTLKSETDDLTTGDIAYITLGVKEFIHLYAFEGELSYDAEKLCFSKAEFSSEGISKVLSSREGILQFLYSSVNENEILDTDKIVTFQFICLTDEDTQVILRSATAVNNMLSVQCEKELSLSASVKMKKIKPPKKPSGGGGSFSGGGTRPQPIQPVPDEPAPEVPESPKNNMDSTANFTGFQDLQGFSWAEEAINWMKEKNLLHGVGEGMFKPAQPMTRAEAAKLLTAAFSSEKIVDVSLTFTDVESNAWYAEFVRSAGHFGWINGYDDDTFRPEQQITREEFAVILMRITQIRELSCIKDKPNFSDYSAISDYAANSVTALAERGVIQGKEDGTFAPQAHVTRAEAAKMLYSVLNNTAEDKSE